ncbi:MAG: hypothetical protein K1X57_05440 [Gemmataceae bacterium]|nr:hypothetical protein [Gemmataceae bacterium]
MNIRFDCEDIVSLCPLRNNSRFSVRTGWGHPRFLELKQAMLDTTAADGVAVHGACDRDGPGAPGRDSAFVAGSASVGLDGMPG